MSTCPKPTDSLSHDPTVPNLDAMGPPGPLIFESDTEGKARE